MGLLDALQAPLQGDTPNAQAARAGLLSAGAGMLMNSTGHYGQFAPALGAGIAAGQSGYADTLKMMADLERQKQAMELERAQAQHLGVQTQQLDIANQRAGMMLNVLKARLGGAGGDPNLDPTPQKLPSGQMEAPEDALRRSSIASAQLYAPFDPELAKHYIGVAETSTKVYKTPEKISTGGGTMVLPPGAGTGPEGPLYVPNNATPEQVQAAQRTNAEARNKATQAGFDKGLNITPGVASVPVPSTAPPAVQSVPMPGHTAHTPDQLASIVQAAKARLTPPAPQPMTPPPGPPPQLGAPPAGPPPLQPTAAPPGPPQGGPPPIVPTGVPVPPPPGGGMAGGVPVPPPPGGGMAGGVPPTPGQLAAINNPAGAMAPNMPPGVARAANWQPPAQPPGAAAEAAYLQTHPPTAPIVARAAGAPKLMVKGAPPVAGTAMPDVVPDLPGAGNRTVQGATQYNQTLQKWNATTAARLDKDQAAANDAMNKIIPYISNAEAIDQRLKGPAADRMAAVAQGLSMLLPDGSAAGKVLNDVVTGKQEFDKNAAQITIKGLMGMQAQGMRVGQRTLAVLQTGMPSSGLTETAARAILGALRDDAMADVRNVAREQAYVALPQNAHNTLYGFDANKRYSFDKTIDSKLPEPSSIGFKDQRAAPGVPTAPSPNAPKVLRYNAKTGAFE